MILWRQVDWWPGKGLERKRSVPKPIIPASILRNWEKPRPLRKKWGGRCEREVIPLPGALLILFLRKGNLHYGVHEGDLAKLVKQNHSECLKVAQRQQPKGTPAVEAFGSSTVVFWKSAVTRRVWCLLRLFLHPLNASVFFLAHIHYTR